jgi:hypothetical protein
VLTRPPSMICLIVELDLARQRRTADPFGVAMLG